MVRRRPPGTEEGWYALHDLRRIDWDAWRAAPDRERKRAIDEGIDYLRAHAEVSDAEAGGSAVFTVVGHKADLLILHLRPTLGQIDRAERHFETTALAEVTDRAASYVSVTEVSGYMHEELTDGLDDIEDAGMRNYMAQRIHPEIPDADHVCFYPMDKRRDVDRNWYDLPFEERAEYMSAHGEIGREYAGDVTQIITGSIGLDDHEWGVTLFADDPTDIKHLLYEMRFDPSTSRFAEFGTFYVGRQFPPEDLGALFDGEAVPTDEPLAADAAAELGDRDTPPTASVHGTEDDPPMDVNTDADATESVSSSDGGRPSTGEATHEEIDVEGFQRRVHRFGIDLSEHPEAGYALLFRSNTDAENLVDEVEGLRENFEHYDTHVLTTVRADSGDTAVVSLWSTDRAANTASGFLSDLSGAGPGVGTAIGDERTEPVGTDEDDDLREELADLDVYAGQPHGEDVHAIVLYSEADPDELASELDDLAEHFEQYDTHVTSSVYRDSDDGDRSAVVSIWETDDAAEKAGGFLSELPGVVARADESSNFGTMGMFYTVKPDHREEFVETFGEVGEALAEMDGHLDSRLLVNVDDENDMFIASQWREREDAMSFFRSDEFRETVEWGREILADRPRHVFLA